MAYAEVPIDRSKEFSMPANQDQLDFWNGKMGYEWTVLQERMDANLSAIHDALMLFAAPRPGLPPG